MPNETAREIFVENLRRLMDARHLNQTDIATALGTTPSTVSDWCLGKKYPRVDTMQRLADLLDVPMSSLTLDIVEVIGSSPTNPTNTKSPGSQENQGFRGSSFQNS